MALVGLHNLMDIKQDPAHIPSPLSLPCGKVAMFSLLEMRVQFILCHSSTQCSTQQGLHSYLMDGWMIFSWCQGTGKKHFFVFGSVPFV